jgi:rubrerythrin
VANHRVQAAVRQIKVKTRYKKTAVKNPASPSSNGRRGFVILFMTFALSFLLLSFTSAVSFQVLATKEKGTPMFSVLEILDLAVQLEKNGESVYRNAVDKVTNPDLVSLLTWMADEEVRHIRWFSEVKEKYEAHSINPFMEEMSRHVFGGILGDKSFSHKDVDFTRVDRSDDLIGIFIEFEKDTVLFYETLIPFIEDNDTLENIAEIIAEENNHIKKLQDFLVDKTAVSLADN